MRALYFLAVAGASAQNTGTPLHKSGKITYGDATLESGPTPGSAVVRLRAPSRIDWESLHLSAGESLRLRSETGSIASLHVVRGPAPARLDGHVMADGPFYLVSPAGISLGASGRVQAPRVFMSALAAADETALLSGAATRLTKTGPGLVEISGTIEAAGGQLTVLGSNVSLAQGALLNTQGGRIHVAAVDTATLTASGPEGVVGVPPGPRNTASRANITTQGHLLAHRIDLISEGFIRNGGHLETTGPGNRVLLSAVTSTHELRPRDASRITTDNLVVEGDLRLEGPVVSPRDGANPAPVGGQRQTPRLSEPGFITQSDARSTQIAYSPMHTLATTSPIPPPTRTTAVASRRGPVAEESPRPRTPVPAKRTGIRKAAFFDQTVKK